MSPEQQSLVISSPEFVGNGLIPQKYTCEAEGLNPPLVIGNVPENTHSMVLIMEDPDAPSGTVTHWVLYDILPGNSIDENTDEGVKGLNTRGKMGYLPICPPDRTHRYYIHVFALDSGLNLPPGADRKTVEEAMASKIMASGTLMGRYNKVSHKSA
jgi:Raf kinase inhibitor-like YbhB/YbcL family protein